MKDYSDDYSDEELMKIAGINPAKVAPLKQPQSSVEDYSDNYSDEELMQIAGVNPQKVKGFFDKQRERGAAMANQDLAAQEGKTLKPEAQFNKAGQFAGGVNDAIGQGISSTYNTLMTDEGKQRVNQDLQKLSQTEAGQMGLQALQKGGEIWNTYKQANPRTANILESTANIGGAVMGLGGIAKGGTVLADAAPEIGSIRGLSANRKNIPDAVIASEIPEGEDLVLSKKGKLTKPMQKIYDRLKEDLGEDEAIKVLNSYSSTQGKSLLETGGQRTANLAEGSAIFPSGGAAASEFFEKATDIAPQKLKTSLSKTVSPETNYYDTLDEIVESGRKEAKPLYNEFYKIKSIQSPLIDKILRTPEGRSALGESVKDIQNEMSLVARPEPELTEIARELARAGEMEASPGGVAMGLKPKTLDYIKRSMDGTINKAIRAGDDAEAARIIKLKNAFVGEIDAQDKRGLYKKARATSGDYISNKKAMELGTSFLKDDPQLIARNFENFGSAEKKAYKVGALKAAYDRIDNITDGRNVASIFNKPVMRQRLNNILSAKEYSKLVDDANAVDNIYKLKNQITGNSRTALRQVAGTEFDDAGQQIVTDIAQKGFKSVAVDKTVGLIKRRFSGLNDKLAKDVADILYETDPKKKYQIVKALTNEFNRNKSSEAGKKLAVFYEISDDIAEEANK